MVLPLATLVSKSVVSRQLLLSHSQLALKWSDRKRAPEKMYKGAAVVHDTTAYIIGADSCTVYSYKVDGDEWNKHSECPHINPGLIIINNLLTAVGSKEEGRPTGKLCTWKHNG